MEKKFIVGFLVCGALLLGCQKTFHAKCSDSPKSLKIESSANVVCPAKCTSGSIWGTDSYTTDSSICLAAVHAGVIKADTGGKVKVKITKGLSSYEGSVRNGITTHKWGSYDHSFTVK